MIVALVLFLASSVSVAAGVVSPVAGGQQYKLGSTLCTDLGSFGSPSAVGSAYAPYAQKKYYQDWCAAPSQTGSAPTLEYTGCTAVAVGSSCSVFFNFNGAGLTYSIDRLPDLAASCPANSTGTSTCTCNTGYVPNSGATACVPMPPPTCPKTSLGGGNFEFPIAAGLDSLSGVLPESMSACAPVPATATTAAGGCTHKYSLVLASRAGPSATTAIGNYNESTDGTNCTPNPAVPGPTPEGTGAVPTPNPPASSPAAEPKPTPNPSTICALGAGSVAMCPTMVNGAVACVVCGQMATAGNGASGGTGTAPAGAASAPGSGSGSSGIGQSINTGNGTVGIPVGGTALQGTECTNGVCTTKTFVKDAGGTVVGAYTSTTPQTVFCSKNAGDPICVAQNTGPSGKPGTGSGSGGGGSGGTGEGEAAPTFGGTCGAGFTCTGDAVQCAMARDQMLRNCKNFDDAASNDPVVQAANAAASSPAGHPINSGTSKSLAFDQTNILSGSCPADVTVTVSHFNAVTLPFASLCTPATWLGNILVGITALSCLGIVFVRGS